jgi:hypothetical protein
MAYCGPRGIPLSVFLSWAPDDQAAALAWQADEASRCPNCRTAEWEWAEDPNAYETETRVCPGCMRVHEASKASEDHRRQVGGVHVLLRRPVPDG